MESQDPPSGDSEEQSGREPRSGAEDALRRLEERLGRASEAAERLIAEATGSARAAAGAGREAAGASEDDPEPSAAGWSDPPPAGWQIPRRADERGQSDLEMLLAVVQPLRDLIPVELQRRLTEALRELLLAIRALIDWYLERTERRRTAAGEVQDIPIL